MTGLIETTVDAVTTPWVVGSAIVASVVKVLGLSALVDFLAATAAQWFGVIAIFSGTLAPNVEWIPTDAAMGAFLGIAAVTLLVRADRTIKWMRDKYS